MLIFTNENGRQPPSARNVSTFVIRMVLSLAACVSHVQQRLAGEVPAYVVEHDRFDGAPPFLDSTGPGDVRCDDDVRQLPQRMVFR